MHTTSHSQKPTIHFSSKPPCISFPASAIQLPPTPQHKPRHRHISNHPINFLPIPPPPSQPTTSNSILISLHGEANPPLPFFPPLALSKRHVSSVAPLLRRTTPHNRASPKPTPPTSHVPALLIGRCGSPARTPRPPHLRTRPRGKACPILSCLTTICFAVWPSPARD